MSIINTVISFYMVSPFLLFIRILIHKTKPQRVK